MLTKKQIERRAMQLVKDGEAPLWCVGFAQGATWANAENAAMIIDLQKQYAEQIFASNKALERMSAENAEQHSTCNGLRAENERMKSEFFRMQGENMALKMTIDEIRAEIENDKALRENMADEITSLRKALLSYERRER